jgi:serine protease Do
MKSWSCLSRLLLSAMLWWSHAVWASDVEAQSRALQRASDAVVGLKATIVEGARSAGTLGPEREGSGVVIGADGLVLTIGYLVLEAESVLLIDDLGREWPARVVSYDVATGLALVQSLVPMPLAPAPLGASSAVGTEQPLMIVSGGGSGAISMARLVSRRAFSGTWEYHLDAALYTAPGRRDHSGAGLFNDRGELVGVGSLWLADAQGGSSGRVPGNLFVPTDLLEPVLPELRRGGENVASARAWLGVQCAESARGLRVLRVNPDSPADVAGLTPGDTIERIDGTAVITLEGLYKTLWSGGPAERDVQLDLLRDGRQLSVTVSTVDRRKTFARPRGI